MQRWIVNMPEFSSSRYIVYLAICDNVITGPTISMVVKHRLSMSNQASLADLEDEVTSR
jgi:hypothetical protein